MHGKAVTVECSPARLVLGAVTKKNVAVKNIYNDFRATASIDLGRKERRPIRNLRQRDELQQRGDQLQQREGHAAHHQQRARHGCHRILPQ